MERKRTAAEIREEFERLQREREERRLQQRTNPKVSKDLILVSRVVCNYHQCAGCAEPR